MRSNIESAQGNSPHLTHAIKDKASPNKMAAKISVPVPWHHILEVSTSPKELGVYTPRQNAMNVSRLSSDSLFLLLATIMFWGSTDSKSFFFSKLGKLILNCVEHSHLRVKSCLAFNNKSKVPVYPTSRNLLCFHKNIFREHIRGLCWQGTQITNIFVLRDYMY